MIHETQGAHSHNCYFSGLLQVEEGNSGCVLRAVGWDRDCPSRGLCPFSRWACMCPEGVELRLAWLRLVCPPDSGVYFHRSFSVKAEVSHCPWTGWLGCTNSPGAGLSKSKGGNGTCAYCIPTACLMVYVLELTEFSQQSCTIGIVIIPTFYRIKTEAQRRQWTCLRSCDL